MPLEDIRVFEAVARHLSFSAAADELALTHGAVSKRIMALEAKCGALLLERSSRKVALTRAGQLLWAAASSALSQLDVAWQLVGAAPAPRSPLRIVVSCERSLALRWLIPRLAEFQAQHPGVVVHVHAGGGAPDFAAEGLDLAIRRNDFVPASQLQLEPLMPEAMALVLAPSLLPAWQQAPQRVRRLHAVTRPLAWARWDVARPRDAGSSTALAASGDPAQSQQFEHWFLAIQAAESGLGALVAPVVMVMDALQQGRLVAPDGCMNDDGAYLLLWPLLGQRSSVHESMVQWLKQQAQAVPVTLVPNRVPGGVEGGG